MHQCLIRCNKEPQPNHFFGNAALQDLVQKWMVDFKSSLLILSNWHRIRADVTGIYYKNNHIRNVKNVI